MSDLTRETLAELQRLQDEYLKAVGFHDVTEAWFGLARAAVGALPALLDAAAERDALAADADKWQRAALTLQGDRDALRAVQPTYPDPTPNPYRQTEGA